MVLSGKIETQPEVDGVGAELDYIERTLGGDASAFDRLVIAYQDRIQNVLFRMLGNRDEAEEVAQEAFLKAYRSLATFKGGARFSTWIYRIAMNAASDRRRRNRYRREHEEFSLDASATEDGDSFSAFAPANDPGPSESAAGNELREEIEIAIAELDEEFRAVIVLKDIEGLNYGEIARVLDVSLGTVKSRLFRARDRLAERLKDLV